MERDRRKRLDLPDRRKHTYEQLEDRVNRCFDALEAKLSRWIRMGLVAFGFVGITSVIALVAFSFALSEIRENRERFTRDACESTNTRNQDTSEQLTALAKADEDAAKTEAGKKEIRRRRDVTLALIDALQPVQDCDYLVGLALGEITPTPTPTPIPSPTIVPTRTP